MTKSKVTIEPTTLESVAASTRLAAAAQPAVVRGWKAASNPEVLEARKASDEARIAALSAKLLADMS